MQPTPLTRRWLSTLATRFRRSSPALETLLWQSYWIAWPKTRRASNTCAPCWRLKMRGVTRSFWALAIVLGAVEGYFVYLALASLHRVLPCWWGFIPHPANSFAACGERVVLFGANSWVPAAVILAVFLA